MDSRKLKPAQVARLQEAIGRQLGYVRKLCARMRSLGFPQDDPLQREAVRAESALQSLFDAARRLRQQGRRLRGQPPWE